jgi:two-component sensor histidine kinase
MKWRLFAVAVTAILPPLISLGYNEFSIRQTYVAAVYDAALRNAKQAKFEVDQIVGEVGAVLFVTSTMRVVTAPRGDMCAATFAEILTGTAALESMTLIGLDGRVLCTSRPGDIARTFEAASWYKRTIETNARAVGELERTVENGDFVLPVAVPVHGAGGQTIAVLMAEMKMRWLDERIRERGIARDAALSVADRNGTIIARLPDPQNFLGKRFPDDLMKYVKAAKPGTAIIDSIDGSRRVLGYVPPTDDAIGLYVGVGLSATTAFAVVNNMTTSTVVAIVSGLALGLLCAWLIGSHWVVRPVRRIMTTIDAWRHGDMAARTGLAALPDGDIGEIGAALDDFMREIEEARRLTERSAQYRELLMRELGHRVKNTLAIAVSMANQMFRHSPEERDAFTQRLMALAGAYDLLLTENWSSATLMAVVAKTVEPHLTTPEQLQTSGPVIDLPAALVLSLSLVLHELATNAVKYGSLSKDNGRLSITWSATPRPATSETPADGTLDVQLDWVERDGPPVKPPERQGFGSKLLARAFQTEFRSNVTLDYAEDGVRAQICFTIPPKGHRADDLLP